ncbi:uncharacterized protein [Littorina saxatilis]|uniref:RING-type domain-containing protein n=1 Tax=Littorina saxatilis TaxID=31220 RepID=A0AAN9GIZ7_9CAEN
MAEKKRTRLRICELNPHLLCALCGGYLIDATTIVECLHSFCKTCILRYLETSNYCPICEVLIHKKRPWQNIRLDHTLQNAVYKLVPGLFKREMQRRRDFYEKNPPPVGKETEQVHVAPERIIFSEDEKFSVSLEFSPNGRAVQVANDKSVVMQPHHDKRFLLCPANVCIGHLKKFVRLKYTLPESYQIDLFYSDEPLEDTYTLMDVAYIYSWRRESVLTLYYSFYQCPRKRRRITASATATSQDRDTTSTANHIKAKTANSTSSSSANNTAPTTTTTSTVTIVEASEAGGVTETEGTKTTVSLSVPATSTTTTTSAAVSLPLPLTSAAVSLSLPLPRASIGSLNSQSSSTLVDFDDDDDDDDDERPLIIVTDTPAASSTTTDTDLPESESGVTIINHPKTHGNKDGGRGCEANGSAGGGNDATDGFIAKSSTTTAGLGLSLSAPQNSHAKDKTVVSFISVGASSSPKPGAFSSCGAIGSSSSVSSSCAAESPSLKKETIGCKEPSPHVSSLQSKEQPFRLQSTTTPSSKPDCTGTSPKKSCSKPSAEPAKSTSSSKSAPSTPAAEPTCLTPTSTVSCSKLSSEPKRSTASSESKRPTATSAPVPAATPSEPKRSATSSESKPSSDPKPAAPPSQSMRQVLPSEPKRYTLSSETMRSAPPSQLARKAVPPKAKNDSSPVNQPSVNSKEQQRCNELAAQRFDASRPKEVARPKESQHLGGHSSGSKEPQNKKDILGASKQSAPAKELLQPNKPSASTKPSEELPRQTESSRPTDSLRAKDTMRALESSSPARPKESARPLDSQRPNITSSKSSGNGGVSSKSISGGASTSKSSTGGTDGSTKSPSGGGSIARHESNKKDARPVSSVKPSPPDASASQSGGKQPPSCSSSSSSSTNYSNKPASEGLFERIYSVTSNSTSSGIKSIFKTTAIVPATSARRYSDVSGISTNASLGERRASVGGSSPSLKLSPGRDKVSKSPGDPKQKASPSRDSRSSLDALSQLTKQSGLSSPPQGNKPPQPTSTHNKTGACSKEQAKDMTKPSGAVLCNASDKRHSSNVSGASVPTLASHRRPSSGAMPNSAKRPSGSYDPGGTTELDTGPTPEKRRSVDSAPTATVDRKNTPTTGNDSNTPTASSDSKNTPTATSDRKNTQTAASDNMDTPFATCDSKNTSSATIDRKITPTVVSDSKNAPTLAAHAGRDVKVPVNSSAVNDSKVTVTRDIKSLVTPSSADIKQNTKAPFAIITGDLRVKLPKCSISDQRLLSPSIPGKDKHGGSTSSSDTKANIAGAALNLHSSPKVCGHEYIPNFLGVITTKPVYASVSSAVTAKSSDESKSKTQIGLMVKQSSINNNNGTTKPLAQSGVSVSQKVGATKKEEAPNSFSYKVVQGSVSNKVAQGTVSNTVPVTNSSSSARKVSTVKVNSTERSKVKTVHTVNAAPPSQQESSKEEVGATKTDVKNAGVVEKAGVKGELGIAKNVDVKGNSGEHTAGVKPETKAKSAGAKSDATASSGGVQRDGSSGIAGVKRLHSSSNTAPSSSSGHSASTTSTTYSIVSSSAATVVTSSKAMTNHATKTPTSAASQLRIPCVGGSGGGGGGPDAKKARLSPASGVQFSMSPPITPTILSSSSSAGAQSPVRAAAGGVTTPATVGLPASGKTTFSTNVSSAVGVNTKIRATGNQAMSGGKTLAPGQRVDSLLFRATNRLAAAAASAAAARPMTLNSLQVLPPGQKKVRSESVDSRMSFINKTFGGGKSSKETVVSPTAGRGEISFSARHILSSAFHSHVIPVSRGGSSIVSPSSASASGNKGGSAAGRGGSGDGPSSMAGRGNTATSSMGRGRVAVAKPGTSPSAAKDKHISSSKDGNAAGACDLSKRSSSSGGRREGLSNGSSSSGKESGGGGGGMKLDIPRLSSGSSRDSVFASDPESSPTPPPKYSDINRNPIKLEPGSKLCRKDTWMTAENGGRRSTGSVGSPSSLGSGPGSPLESERSPARDARRPSDSELLMAQRWHGLAHPHLLAIPHPRDPATAAAVAAALYNGHFKVPPSAKYLPLAHEHVARPSSPEPMPLDYSTSSSSSK